MNRPFSPLSCWTIKGGGIDVVQQGSCSMKRTIGLILVGGACVLTGCSTSRTASARSDNVAIGAMGPAVTARASNNDIFFLGAGDALGLEVFTYYVATLRAEEQFYATGEDERPDED
jgi:hypothetical protein